MRKKLRSPANPNAQESWEIPRIGPLSTGANPKGSAPNGGTPFARRFDMSLTKSVLAKIEREAQSREGTPDERESARRHRREIDKSAPVSAETETNDELYDNVACTD